MIVVGQALSAAAMFGVVAQLISLLVAILAVAVLIDRRGQFDTGVVS